MQWLFATTCERTVVLFPYMQNTRSDKIETIEWILGVHTSLRLPSAHNHLFRKQTHWKAKWSLCCCTMQYTVDDVFELIGQFGWSQRTYFLLLGILQIFVAPQMLLNVFTGRWLKRYSGFHSPHSHNELWVITRCTSLISGGSGSFLGCMYTLISLLVQNKLFLIDLLICFSFIYI